MSYATFSATESMYEFIRSYYEDHGISPTVREIQDALNISSTSVVAYRIKRLVEDGRLIKVHNRSAARNIIPTVSL